MQKVKTLLLLLIAFPVLCHGQFIGLGGQYSQASDGQFFVNMGFPTYHQDNKLNLFNTSGFEYTTSGGAKLSGLNIKPIQLSTYFSEDLYNDNPLTCLLGVDAGYLFDFRKNHKNTIVVTPNLYVDYKVFFIKTGYDIDTFHGNSQFFIRAGIGIGLGTFKVFSGTKIK